ncbi:MAG: CotH kinase family protein [Bacteroidota bacterium]
MEKLNKQIKKFLFILSFALILLFLGCSENDKLGFDNIPGAHEGPDIEIPTVIPTGEEAYLNEDSDYIFDQDRLHTFHLHIANSALYRINSNPSAEEYVEAMMIFDGDTISPIGVRYKGSIGAFVNCLSGNDWTNPTGHKTCTKLSMKVKINWEGREEKFFKLRKLQFHSQNNDDSQMHERLGYWLFREMGVPAPRSVHARLMINGSYVGLFALTEQIDGRFAKYHFKDDDGNMYKEIWPLSMEGVPYSVNEYIQALKTNEDSNPSVDLIRGLGQEIINTNSLNQRKSIVEKYMDIEETISYVVVDRAIRHDDGPFHWYCVSDECTNHNYYFYEEPKNKKLHLIPWDLDNAFENIIFNKNPVTPIADKWGNTSNNCKPFAYGSFSLSQWSAGCDKLTATWASYVDLYDQKKNELTSGPMSLDKTNEMLDLWSEQILNATKEASDLHSDAVSVEDWRAELTLLKSQLEYARNQ